MSEMSRQPTHHGYAVNVKDHTLYAGSTDVGPLSDEHTQAIYETHVERFWRDVQEVARDHGFQEAFSEGRMGGWCVPAPQPSTEDMWESEVEAWERDTFRPFERDVLALIPDVRADFLDDLADEVARATVEPAERAYWEARGVPTV